MSKLTRGKILAIFIILTALFATLTFLSKSTTSFEISLFITILTGIGLGVVIHDIIQTQHSLLRNYPLIGRLRWVFEHERSKIQQYFIEDDTNGTPYNREARSDVYQKAKGDINTTPFGTQLDVYEKGYEFVKHSMYPKDIKQITEPRVTIGSKFCTRPYSASIFNVSAMSYGALSDAAVKAINGGAKLGNFYQNTGEGGLSPYHKEEGGDLCFQIGTGYFGAGKTEKGVRVFDDAAFKRNAMLPQVKMIEIKLSQGAKPGHGGILPAKKNTKEIAEIRGVEPGVDVMSPPYHTAFNNPDSMLRFVKKLRQLSNGKPIGIKMCLGDEQEVAELIAHMKKINTFPDFITIDGGEGGTGAAPIVFTNSIGTPLVDALVFIDQQLKLNGLRDQVKIIASGKASTSFDIVKLLSIGADCVNAARAFMLSLGCIQARECNKNTCPVGIATQNPHLVKGLNPAEKRVRVYNYHKAIIHEVKEVMAAMGVDTTDKLDPSHINVRIDKSTITTYKDLFQIK
jgi:glutamate synthase domain-containing protein 2